MHVLGLFSWESFINVHAASHIVQAFETQRHEEVLCAKG